MVKISMVLIAIAALASFLQSVHRGRGGRSESSSGRALRSAPPHLCECSLGWEMLGRAGR